MSLRSLSLSRQDWMLLVLISALVAAFVLLPRKEAAPVGATVLATPAPEVRTVERVTERPKIVSVYPDKAKEKLGLPEAIREDAKEKVVASSRVPDDGHEHTVTTTLNLDTGRFTTLSRAEPRPWLARDDSGEVGILYGFKDGAPAARLEARQNLIAIKDARIGIAGTLDQDGSWYAGMGVWMRW